ncbi:hypothetical protein CDIK_0432 [Cucumispora dikerogammari]|nr:hypothetical protein CDIK_0432 [Cucumispora dikerogammari]
MIRYKQVKIKTRISIEPEDIKNIENSVNKHFNKQLFKYSEPLGGFLLSFKLIERSNYAHLEADGVISAECLIKSIYLYIEENSVITIKEGMFLNTFLTNLKGDCKMLFKRVTINDKGKTVLYGDQI